MKNLFYACLFCLPIVDARSVFAQSAQPGLKSTAKIEGLINVAAENAIQRGLEALANSQKTDGTFGIDRQWRGNVAVCSLAGLAFLSEGSTPERGVYARQITKCIEYLVRHCGSSGLISNADFEGSGPMYGHGFATLFLSEVHGMTTEYDLKKRIESAVNLIVLTQNDEGGWRYQPVKGDADLSVTVCQVMALRAAKNAGIYVPSETIDQSVEYVKLTQNPDGGFSYRLQGERKSEFPRSAAALVALQSAGIYRGREFDSGVTFLEKFSPKSSQLQSSYFYYGHYYAVQAMWHRGGESWSRWYTAIRDELVLLQQSGGKWTSRYSAEYSTAMALIILQIPNNILHIFQR